MLKANLLQGMYKCSQFDSFLDIIILFRLINTLERFTTLIPLGVAGSNRTSAVTIGTENFLIHVDEAVMERGEFQATQLSAGPSSNGSELTVTSTMTESSVATVNLRPSVFEAVFRTSNATSNLRVNAILYKPSNPLFQDSSTNGTGGYIFSVRVTPGVAPTNLENPVTFTFFNNKVLYRI